MNQEVCKLENTLHLYKNIPYIKPILCSILNNIREGLFFPKLFPLVDRIARAFLFLQGFCRSRAKNLTLLQPPSKRPTRVASASRHHCGESEALNYLGCLSTSTHIPSKSSISRNPRFRLVSHFSSGAKPHIALLLEYNKFHTTTITIYNCLRSNLL
jgi:hypothetical protein